jgi:hypothetical protein
MNNVQPLDSAPIRHFDQPKRAAMIEATADAELLIALVLDWIKCMGDFQLAAEGLPLQFAAMVEHVTAVVKRLDKHPYSAVRSLLADWDCMAMQELRQVLPDDRLGEFVAANLFEVPGHLLPYGEFYDRFRQWLPQTERGEWSRYKVSKTLQSSKYKPGVGRGNKTFIVNASFEQLEAQGRPYLVANGRIKRT